VLYENLTFEIPPLWFFKSSRGIKKIWACYGIYIYHVQYRVFQVNLERLLMLNCKQILAFDL
jgi:hypothetical protein